MRLRNLAVGLAAALLLAVGLTMTVAHPASASRSCSNYTLNGQVADVASWGGYDYILTRTGSVYGHCAPYYGGAGGQGYFAGRVARDLTLCIFDNRPVGYRITATSGEQYNYGRFWSCWGFDTGGDGGNVGDFWVSSAVTDVAASGGYRYIITTDGGVWTFGSAPWYGDPRNQGYFQGRTADYLELHGSVAGYCVIATSNERYCYGG